MALSYKKQKNLIRSPDEYTRYYGNFRGVDFSSEETEVDERRFAYAVNMYKDYRSSEGNAIETIPGFRRRFETPLQQNARSGTATNEKINGIHEFAYTDKDGNRQTVLVVHAGTHLYVWDKNKTVNTLVEMHTIIPDDLSISMEGTSCSEVASVEIPSAKSGKLEKDTFSFSNSLLTLFPEVFNSYKGMAAIIRYKEGEMKKENAIYDSMNDNESKAFTFNNRLYILDGTTFRVCYLDKDDNWKVESVASSEYTYTPTTYKGIPAGDIVDNISNYEYEQKNLINNFYVHEYTQQDGTIRVEFPLYSNDSIDSVVGYNPFTKEQVEFGTDDQSGYKIEFYKDAAGKNTEARKIVFPSGILGQHYVQSGIYIRYKKRVEATSEDKDGVSPAEKDMSKINKCTNYITFDNRIFLTGNPDYPNLLFYCGNNNKTGYIDPTYFGELDYVQDGVEDAPITGLITVADTLAVLKNHAKQDSSIYFHTRMETNAGVTPITYPSQPGLSGVGCLGACVNFLDDPIFISPLGVEAIGQLSVRLERAVEHRSSLIDAKLTSMDLSKAKFAEWDGYLVLLLPGGKMFLADSRQRYTHSSGVMQYEWYYIEGVGVYEDDDPEYYYSSEKEDGVPDTVDADDGKTYEVVLARNIYNHDSYLDNGKTYKPENLINSPVKKDAYADDDEELEVKRLDDYGYYFYILKPTWDGHSMKNGYPETEVKAILCENRGSRTGGTFHEATHIINVDRNLFFGTNNGVICSFNFDLFKDGMLPEHFYSFDGHTINCGVATKLDNCGIPHLTKSTIKKSTVLKTKSMHKFAAKIRVRTNNKGYESIARVNSNIFDFENTDFSDYSFANSDQTIFSIKEKEKHWVEKQHWIYSDEFERPFAVHYLAFRYKVSGRIKG